MRHTHIISVVGLLALAGGFACAQDAQPVDDVAESTRLSKTSFSLEVGARWIGKADLDSSPGELGIARVGGQFGVSHQLSDAVTLTFGAGIEHSVYDFENASGLVAGTSDPFDDATEMTLSLGARIKSGEQNAWFVTGFVSSAGESGSAFDETLTGGGVVGFTHSFDEKLTLGIGVLVASKLEDDLYIIPVPVIHWKISERWSLSTGERANVRLEYAPSETWAFGAELAWERHEFRLDDQGPLPSGVVEERHVPVGVFARFSPNANIAIEANVGANTFSNLQIDSQAGVRVADEDIDPAIYAGFGVRVRF